MLQTGSNADLPQYRQVQTQQRSAPLALIVVPTRELAIQVCAELKRALRPLDLRCGVVYGGDDKQKQLQELIAHGGAHVVVGTPGRLLDLVAGKQLSLLSVSVLVLDEADRMLQMGFYEQLQALSSQVRPDRQALLFSATFPGKLREAAESWVGNAVFVRCGTFDVGTGAKAPARVEAVETSAETREEEKVVLAAKNMPVSATESNPQPGGRGVALSVPESVVQSVHVCAAHKKPRLLLKFILRIREQERVNKVRQPGNVIVFCTKIKTLKFVSEFLVRHDTKGVVSIHGQMPQALREKALNDFKAGKASILVATDVAARGLHIKKLQYVVNYDFPSNLEQYCHRVGRTGRQGESGHAYSLITRNMAPMVSDLIALLRTCKQEPEPNLLALEEEFRAGGFVPDEGEEECAAGTEQGED